MDDTHIFTITLTTGLTFHVNGDDEDLEILLGMVSNKDVTALTFSRPRIGGRGPGDGANAITVKNSQIASVEYLAQGKGSADLLKIVRKYAGDRFIESRS